MCSGLGSGDLLEDRRSIIDRHDEDDQGGEHRDAFKIERQAIPGTVKLPEDTLGGLGPLHLKEKHKNHRQTEDANPRERPFVLQFDEGIDHQHEEAEGNDNDFEIINRHGRRELREEGRVGEQRGSGLRPQGAETRRRPLIAGRMYWLRSSGTKPTARRIATRRMRGTRIDQSRSAGRASFFGRGPRKIWR